jgi:hypothetical protein
MVTHAPTVNLDRMLVWKLDCEVAYLFPGNSLPLPNHIPPGVIGIAGLIRKTKT